LKSYKIIGTHTDEILASYSNNGTLKLWDISKENIKNNSITCIHTFTCPKISTHEADIFSGN